MAKDNTLDLLFTSKNIIDEEYNNQVPFPKLVEHTSGHKVLPVQPAINEDKKLLSDITESADHLLDLFERNVRRLKSNRVNEVGNHIESEFVEVVKSKTDLEIEQLKTSGYPDFKVIDSEDRTTYIEMKATSQKWETSQRTFYYSNGKKIEDDARHILLAWGVEEDSDHGKIWNVTGWKLSDLSGLEVKLKTEFNASNKDLYDKDLVLDENME